MGIMLGHGFNFGSPGDFSQPKRPFFALTGNIGTTFGGNNYSRKRFGGHPGVSIKYNPDPSFGGYSGSSFVKNYSGRFGGHSDSSFGKNSGSPSSNNHDFNFGSSSGNQFEVGSSPSDSFGVGAIGSSNSGNYLILVLHQVHLDLIHLDLMDQVVHLD